MTTNATSAWLAQAVANKYHSPDVVRSHVEAALTSFSGLRPKLDSFTHDTGESVVLLALQGTLPVSFRGVVYNIPVAVWMPLTYPRHPPIAFVTPTANMLVRSGRHVDLAGRVYHPMLANWHNMPSSDVSLTNLLAALQMVFAVEPPVYAKPAIPNQQQPPPVPINPLVQRQATSSPQPGGYSQSPPAIPQKSFSSGNAPVIPPKPNGFNQSPNSAPQSISPPPVPPNPLMQQNKGSGPVYVQFPSSTPPTVPAPPPKTLASSQNSAQSRPMNIPSAQYQYQQPIATSANTANFLASSPRDSSPSPALRQYQQFPQSSDSLYQQYPQQQQQQQYVQQPQHQYQGYPPSQQQQQGYYQSPPQQQQPQQQIQSPHLITPTTTASAQSPTRQSQQEFKQQQEKQERDRRANEIRGILTSRLISSAQDVEVNMTREFERMRSVGAGLMEGEARAKSVLQRLGEEEMKVRKNVEILGSKVVEMKAVIQKVKVEPEVQVDEILTSVSVVHNQLLDLIAEEHALDDLIYQLSQALNAEKVDVAVFMKHTRSLARELFLKRALIKKIQIHIQMQ